MNKKILFSLLPIALLLIAMIVGSFIKNETAYYIVIGILGAAALGCLAYRINLK